jgi:PAS domain S-box-containing protein
MTSTSRHSLLAGFVAALALLGVVAALNWHHAARTQETAAWVAHTHKVRDQLNKAVSSMQDVETGERGFVLTGTPAFLEPYHAAVASVATELRSLRTLTADNRGEQQVLDVLELRITRMLDHSALVVQLRRDAGFAPAQAEVLSGRGKAVMDTIRAEFAQMDATEHTLLDQRSAANKRESDAAQRFTIVGTSLGFVLLIAVFALVLRQERLRQRAEDEVDRFFSVSLDMLCISSADGYFKRISPAFMKTLGWSVGEILARPFLDLVHPDDAAPTLREVERQVIAGEKVLHFDNRYQHKDGSWRWLSWNSMPQPGGLMYATARDITEQKQIGEQIIQLNADLRARATQLEAANKALESFAYSVSHDLRAPLRGMDGFSQALLEDYEGQLDATGRDYLRRVRAGAQQMGQLIDDLLSLSQVTRSGMAMQPVNLTALARKVIAELQPQQAGRAVHWEVSDPLTAHGDPRLLQIALVNLLANALKFTGKCAQARIEFGQQTQGAEQVWFVRDNGAGFDMTYADRLFGAFQRLHTSLEFPGTGIGLATVQRIIHRHGGRVWAEAQPGKGATFYFTIPTAE